ncbi:histidine phosphatase family protein [Belliella kenyensis]|uniref:Multiple inositol polyphosphate phosphatase 1 n=1 Tax=Belliella kenyensis TaxID=1472724 RepID=A0ABV8EIE3_9BACT|nr:histidine phosphatase family protein [Belliella kenyensis]MCH7402704.1 histidine-type phosphatase [Belliella kenyensis]MDN3603748.1 histidine-type phosphatase [Belliella kenyensis]
MKISHNLRRLSLIFWINVFIPNILVYAQDVRKEIFSTIEKSGGVNYAYTIPNDIEVIVPPTGYVPFYISHFGRHGSRYLVSDKEYLKVINVFEKADSEQILTPLGQDVFNRLKIIYSQVEGNGGELTPLGKRQMKEISERMFEKYPNVFTQNAQITAVSTTVGRCINSMELFCEGLREMNPALNINMDSHENHMDYLNHHTSQAVQFRYAKDTWMPEYELFEESYIIPDRLIKSLFLSAEHFGPEFKPSSFMFDLFEIAGNMQNTMIDISLYDLFQKEELYNLWQAKNYQLYVKYGNAAINGGMMMENAMPLLNDILNKAENVISNGQVGASFRFGHDGNIVPLAMLLHIQGTYNSVANPQDYANFWNDFKVAPMAANIQIVFYRHPEEKDVLVTFLYNEQPVSVPPIKTSIFPFYKWSDVNTFYQSLIQKPSKVPTS